MHISSPMEKSSDRYKSHQKHQKGTPIQRTLGESPEMFNLIIKIHAHIDHNMWLYHILEMSPAPSVCYEMAAPSLKTPNIRRT